MARLLKNITANVAAVCAMQKGIKPLDADIHEKIILTALGILRRDGCVRAQIFFKENLAPLCAGVDWADCGKAGRHHMNRQAQTIAVIVKYDKIARVCIRAAQHDLAFKYIGAVLHMLQDACVPSFSVWQMLAADDLVRKICEKRYHPLNSKRARSGALVSKDIYGFLRQAQHTLNLADLHCSGSRGGYGGMMSTGLLGAERLSAGYLSYMYDVFCSEEDFRGEYSKAETLSLVPDILAKDAERETDLSTPDI